MKVEEGTVVSVFADGSAEVKVGRHSDCIACGACEGAKDIVVTAVNKVNAKEGQHVKFEFHDTNIVVGAFICFVMPLLLAAAGAIIGYFVSGSFGTDAVRSEVVGAIVAWVVSSILIALCQKAKSLSRRLLKLLKGKKKSILSLAR